MRAFAMVMILRMMRSATRFGFAALSRAFRRRRDNCRRGSRRERRPRVPVGSGGVHRWHCGANWPCRCPWDGRGARPPRLTACLRMRRRVS